LKEKLRQGLKMELLYEDDSVVVAAKPEGVASIPSVGGGVCALELLSVGRSEKLYVVHRLDKGVSGVLLFAKTATAHRELNLRFQNRQVDKYYLAVLSGKPFEPRGAIEKPLRQFGSGRTGVDLEKGKPCRTEYELLGSSDGFSLVRIKLITGRRHQIRAHFYSVGCPVAGDMRYGDRTKQRVFSRLMLHSWRIRFELFGKRLDICAPPPESFINEAGRLGLSASLERI